MGAAAKSALVVVAAAALGGGCLPERGEYFGTTELRHPADELWTNNGGEPEYIDPGLCADGVGGSIVGNLFEGLTRPDPVTMEPLPGVAERWEKLAGGRRWVFHLRADARWSDGRPVTAHDFEWSWKRVLDPRTAARYASQLYVLAGGQARHEGRGSADAIGVRATDDRTLVVDLQDPIPYFLPLVTTLYTFRPVPRWAVEEAQRDGVPEQWTQPGRIVSNGPFRLVEWSFRRRMVFERNPRYWDVRSVKLRRVIALAVESYTTTLNLYRAGELDFIGENTNLPAETMDLLSTVPDFERKPEMTIYYYWVNTRRPPLDDVRVRRALHHAIDRERITRFVTRAGQIPATTLVPPGIAGYQPPPAPGFDPARARALLAEAGYPGGRGFAGFTLSYNTSEGHKQIAEAVQAMWKDVLGIEVRLESQEWQVFLKNLQQGDYDVARLGWAGDYPDPYTFLEVLAPTSANNHSGWRDAEYGRLLEQGNAQADPAERLRRFQEAERRLQAAQPILPVYLYSRVHLVKPYVRGLTLNIQKTHPWRDIWIDPRLSGVDARTGPWRNTERAPSGRRGARP